MDRRREPRFECQQPARIINLRNDETLDGWVINVSGRGMQVRLPRRLPVNTPVRLDYGDTLLLGDICYCQDDGDTALCGIILAHSLLGTSALASLMQRVTSANPTSPANVKR